MAQVWAENAARPVNAHYEGAYSLDQFEWRRLSAEGKVFNLLRLLGPERPKRILEVGCGTGAVLAELRRQLPGTELVGVDIVDPAAHLDPGAAGLDLRHSDGETLPFPEKSFDLVVASHVLEHVENERPFLRELARVSSRRIYVEVPCEHTVRAGGRGMAASVACGHINTYSPESFELRLETSGLSVLETRIFDHTLPVHSYGTTRARGLAHMAMRRTALIAGQRIASRLFVYHCGALCAPR